MRKLLALTALLMAPSCGGGSSSPTPVARGSAPTPAPTPVPTPTPVPAAFGPGQYLVNSRIQPGRYFADPQRIGCYWERQSGLGGTLSEIIANDVFSYDPRQVIVDILSSDMAFMGDADCGSWYTTPRQPAQANIPPGMWLVGDQVAPGTYEANVGAGCYWERLRNFEGTIRSVISNDFIPDAGPHLVTIGSNDVGFNNDGDCGTWTRAASVMVTSDSNRTSREVDHAWKLSRAKRGLSAR